MNKKVLADNLKKLRLQHNYNQSDVASAIKLHRVTYHGYETGKHEPNIDTLITLSNFYKVSLDYLMGRYNDKLQ